MKESRVLYSDEDSSATYSPPTTSTSLQPSPRKKYKATPTNLWPASELDSLQQYIDKCAQRGLKRNWIQYKKEHKTVKTNIELSIKATSMKVSNLKKVYDEDGVDEEEEEKEKVEEVEEVEEESGMSSRGPRDHFRILNRTFEFGYRHSIRRRGRDSRSQVVSWCLRRKES